MANPNTRIDSEKLKRSAAVVAQKLDEIYAELDTMLDPLTPEERQEMPTPPKAFNQAGRTLARAAVDHPVIAASTAYDPKAVLEDLNNVEIIQPVLEKSNRINQLLADARLAWIAEAYVPSLQVYGVAKVIARQNAEVQRLVDPLASVFNVGRRSKKKTE